MTPTIEVAETESQRRQAVPEFSLAERDRRWNIGRQIMKERDLEKAMAPHLHRLNVMAEYRALTRH